MIRVEDGAALKSIFKRRGKQSGTVEAIESSLMQLIQKENERKTEEKYCLK